MTVARSKRPSGMTVFNKNKVNSKKTTNVLWGFHLEFRDMILISIQYLKN